MFVFTPETRGSRFIGGLHEPYSYSDMTGTALRIVAGVEARAI